MPKKTGLRKKQKGIKQMSVKITTCYHKPAFVVQNDAVFPIHVGKALAASDLGFPGDDTGDNISDKNPYFCELTAIYWLWKNTTDDIVGLFHYRRFLNFKNDETKVPRLTDSFLSDYGITAQNIVSVLDGYDIILPQKNKHKRGSLYQHYAREHVQSDMDLAIAVLKKKHPTQTLLIDRVLKENAQGYFANMFIAKHDTFHRYAEWLFDVLFAVEKQIQDDVLTRDSYQQRVYGFLSERLMPVFVALHPDLNVKEVPMIFIEENKKKYRRYKIRRTKHKILAFLHLRRKK